jgi:hypothetical protein
MKRIHSVPYSRKGGRVYAMKRATARTVPGMTMGASARKPRIWWPTMSLRLVTYASSAASPAPTQAVSTPSSSVLTIAARVASCRKVNDQFSSVKFPLVSGCAQARANAVFSRMP